MYGHECFVICKSLATKGDISEDSLRRGGEKFWMKNDIIMSYSSRNSIDTSTRKLPWSRFYGNVKNDFLQFPVNWKR